MSAPSRPRKAAAKKAAPRAASRKAAEEQPLTPAEFDDEMRELLAEAGAESPIAEDGTITAVKIGKRGRTPNKLVDLFELDGVMYRVPEKPSPAMMLVFLRECRDRRIGTNIATQNLLMNMIGEDAMAALVASPDVTEEDMAAIIGIVSHIAFGTLAKLREAQDPS